MNNEFRCKEGCRFCKIFNGTYDLGKIDNPLLKSKEYMALVSLGAFVEGWTLIIPRKHMYSMKQVYSDPAFITIANSMVDKIKKIYQKPCIVFEHGANHEGSITACGTNHAHLHILPFEESLLAEMKKDEKIWVECHVEEINNLVGENEYWFYSENIDKIENTKGFLHIIEEPESQYFRKLIADKKGYKDQFDYKKHLFLDLAEATYDALKR